jgi:pimeloyl-ACP methyl ester carboxylesterase
MAIAISNRMLSSIKIALLMATTLYQGIACLIEDLNPPPGRRFNIGSHRLHLYTIGDASPTIVLDHSLGGIEGYLLIDKLAKLGRVCIYDRAGYGWSDHSPHPRTSDQIVSELDLLLTKADIKPPYILVGNSFGSYNVRCYAYRFPEKVAGLVLTDGLYETQMLKMSLSLKILKGFFISGFIMSILGSTLGIIRLINICGVFEILKPELRNFSSISRKSIKRSFCRPNHWITMTREMLNLDTSAQQMKSMNENCAFPIVSIKASSFFKPAWWTRFLPLGAANQLREQMHEALINLSPYAIQLQASKSGHFVWVDEPEVLVQAVQFIVNETVSSHSIPLDSPLTD